MNRYKKGSQDNKHTLNEDDYAPIYLGHLKLLTKMAKPDTAGNKWYRNLTRKIADEAKYVLFILSFFTLTKMIQDQNLQAN